MDNGKDTEETAMMVKDENKPDGQLDNHRVVQKVKNTPEVSEKQIDNNLEEKVSLNDSYALEAAGNDENDLLEDLEATTAEASTSDDPTLPKLESNANIVKETQVEHRPEETLEDIIGNPIVNIKEVEVVAPKSKDQLPDAKPDQDNSENDDDDNVDVKVESKVSDRESIAKDDEETKQQLNHNVLDEDENLIAEAEDKFKAKLTNTFIKAEA